MNDHRSICAAIIAASGLVAGFTPAAGAQDAPPAITVGAVRPTMIYLRAGAVDTSAGRAGLAALAGPAAGQRQYVVQLDGPITPDRRARMARAGIQVGAYLPMNAYIVRLDRAAPAAVAGLDFLRWFSEYQQVWKLDPDLAQQPPAPPQATAARPVLVSLFSTLSPAEVIAAQRAVWALPGVVSHWEEDVAGSLNMSLSIRPQDIDALARIPGVLYIEPGYDIQTRNLSTRWIVQSNVPNVTPLYANGLHGEGQILGILDTSVDINHCSLKDTVPIGPAHRKIVGYHATPAAALHGTHCAGIAVGDAGVEAETRGMAYLGRLTYGPMPAFTETAVVSALNLSHADGGRVHTNSWGDDGTTAYNGLCRGFDAFNWANEDDLVCLAVTNGSLLKNPENAKNLLAVGNSNDAPSQQGICTGGAGPTSDGRRKPEVFAPGCNVASAAAGTSCGTTQLTGTSMATPATAGAGMLIRQYFQDGYYPGGVVNSGSAITPTAALMKAMLINSAVDMAAAGYPSNAEGWGRILVDNSMYFFGDARKLLVSDVRHNAGGLTTGAIYTMPVNVLGSGQQFRVTVVWTEPPATAGAAFAAVNDLDLEVDGPAGTYKGNFFVGGSSAPGGTRDDRNNVEQVHINNPAPGQYTVRVKGAAVAQGAQGFAIVATGDVQGGPPPALVISLPAGAPPLIAPGVATNIDVRVQAGGQNVVPGSETMFYRTAPGAFTQQVLTHLSGPDYRATLPALACTDHPEFYFQAAGDGGALVNLPQAAPSAVLSATVGAIQVTPAFTESFESAPLPLGWTATGLWNVTDLCGAGGACDGSRWAYYGDTATCTYDTGVTNSGSLTSPPISIPAVPPGGTVSLRYCSALETENLSGWDEAIVRVNGTEVDRAGESAAWEQRSADLTAYAGQSVTIEFFFDTVDGSFNTFRGWQVDNVRIEAAGLVCAACYPDCNADGALNLSDFGCFTTKFALGDAYTDCNNDGVRNLADFGCFTTKFALGCP
ncbi:MAG: S8 family serine peptidase [Phycisphaerales bacterium]|nr:S8 family serine peptidase [Phycisphaerales bacterium]